jgi:uncharacterized protein (DUF1697 family)
MSTFISMLRGINVSGVRKIAMPELKAVYEALGFTNVSTYVQSGNVVFDSPGTVAQQAASRIESAIQERFAFSVPVFIRSAADLRRIVETNPFLIPRRAVPARLYVTFLYETPDPSRLTGLASLDGAGDEFVIGEQEIFIFCPNGYGRSKLNNTIFENKLKMPATTRNWNTVRALLEMAGG